MKHILDNLKAQTKDNIAKKKDLTYSVPDKYKKVKGYYKTYLEKSVLDKAETENWRPPKPQAKDTEGRSVRFDATPQHSKNTVLAMAFAKAEKLFSEIEKNAGKAKKGGNANDDANTPVLSETDIHDADIAGATVLSPIECLIMSYQLLQGKNSSLIKSIKQGQMEELNEFAAIMPVLHNTLKQLRTYHSHILHEPGPIQFKDIYGEVKVNNKVEQQQWSKARKWFKAKFEDVKIHLLKTLTREKDEKKLTREEREDVENVYNAIYDREFEKNGYLTPDALLFIACMFLRKSEAEYFVRKWDSSDRKPKGVNKTARTFFTYYSIRDAKSLQSQNEELLKFRKIIGILSTMPAFKNNVFQEFNNYIQLHNEEIGTHIERIDSEIEQLKEIKVKERADKDKLTDKRGALKAKKDKWNTYLIPIRRNFNPTHWYMDYLNSRGLLDAFEIAVYKTPDERLEYLAERGVIIKDEGKETFKVAYDIRERMKAETDKDKKQQLIDTYKYTKKNSTFKKPWNAKDDYCVKNETVMVRYPFAGKDGIEVLIQVNLSSDLLMKWVFADMVFEKTEQKVGDKEAVFFRGEQLKKGDKIVLGKGNKIAANIIAQITQRYDALMSLHRKMGEKNDWQSVDLTDFDNKHYGKSISEAVANPDDEFTVDDAKSMMKVRKQQLSDFNRVNKSKKAPWKYAAKKKMNYIFDYVHLQYVYNNTDGKFNTLPKKEQEEKTAHMRHEALSEKEYLEAMEYIRFYGKNYELQEFNDFFFKKKSVYFSSLKSIMDKSKPTSLEELYNAVYSQFQNFYRKIMDKLDDKNLGHFKETFKPHTASKKSDVQKHALMFATNQVVLHELIDLRELGKDTTEYKKWKSDIDEKNKKFTEAFTTDFSFMRYWLGDRNKIDTNSDFMLKVIMPELLNKKETDTTPKLKLKNEKIDGNRSLFNTLMKNKTDELMMWEVARYYWHKANGTAYETPAMLLTRGVDKIADTPYKSKLFFYKVFGEEMEVRLNEQIKIKIRPRKFDDEFQYYDAQQELLHFIKAYKLTKEQKKDQLSVCLSYEEVNKEMKDVIAKYLDDAFMLLSIEKKIVNDNYDKLTDLLHGKLEKDSNPYYYKFGKIDEKLKKKNPAKYEDDNILAQLVYEAINTTGKGFSREDLLNYRNNSLHQQVHQMVDKYINIKKALINYCVENNIIV